MVAADVPIRVGVTGAGQAFDRLYLPALALVREAKAVAVADVRAVTVTGLRSYRTLEAMQVSERLEGLLVLSSPAVHGRQVSASLARGLPVLCGKPAASAAAEVDGWPAGGEFGGSGRCIVVHEAARIAHGGTCSKPTQPGRGRTNSRSSFMTLVPHALDLAEWLTRSEIVEQRLAFWTGAQMEGVFVMADGRTFAWRVAYGGRYREELFGDGHLLVRRRRWRGLRGRFRTREGVEGAALVLGAWAARLRGKPADGDVLADRDTVRRHAAMLEELGGWLRGTGR